MKPGLLGLAGKKIEKRCVKELKSYFRYLYADIRKLRLEELASTNAETEEIVRHAIEMRLSSILRRHSDAFGLVLVDNLTAAYKVADKMDYAQEASGNSIDRVGPSAKEAAKWAEQYSGKLIKGINKTVEKNIADAVMAGIEGQLGVPGTGRLLRDFMADTTVSKAEAIAATEMNAAMSAAALSKMKRIGLEYKQLILSDDACEICQDNADVDPIPVEDDYPSGDPGPPFHTRCRCAVTGARPPEEE